MGFTLQFRVWSIILLTITCWSLWTILIILHPNVLSVWQCAESTTKLPRFKIKVTPEGHVVIYPWISCLLHISPEPFVWFTLNFTQILVRRCAEPMTQLCRLKFERTMLKTFYQNVLFCICHNVRSSHSTFMEDTEDMGRSTHPRSADQSLHCLFETVHSPIMKSVCCSAGYLFRFAVQLQQYTLYLIDRIWLPGLMSIDNTYNTCTGIL